MTKAHEALRAKINKDVQDFIKNGGVIVTIATGVSTTSEVLHKVEAGLGKLRLGITNRTNVFGIYDMEEYLASRSMEELEVEEEDENE